MEARGIKGAIINERVSLEKYFWYILCSCVGEGKEIFVLIIETFRISSRVVILEKYV